MFIIEGNYPSVGPSYAAVIDCSTFEYSAKVQEQAPSKIFLLFPFRVHIAGDFSIHHPMPEFLIEGFQEGHNVEFWQDCLDFLGGINQSIDSVRFSAVQRTIETIIDIFLQAGDCSPTHM